LLTVNAVNDAPAISGIADQTIDEDTATGAIPFTISDLETPAGSLVVSASSSNPGLIPATGILLAGSDSNRTIALTPAPNQFGSTTITLSVSDGDLTSITSFLLTVNSVNDAPVISAIANQTIDEDAATGAIPFTINDVETPAGSLVVSASSSNPGLIPATGILLAGSDSNWTVALTPALNHVGTATITLSVNDGDLTSSTSFLLTVDQRNHAPVVSAIADQTIEENTSTGAIPFTISDLETPASTLLISASSSDPALVPAESIVVAGSDSNRTITVVPAPNRSGSVTIALSVSDGQLTTTTQFLLTVYPVNDSPFISPIPDYVVVKNGSSTAIAFTVGDVETAAEDITVFATSGDPNLVPVNQITFGGTGSNRTITISPRNGRIGSTTITVSASDGISSASTSFLVIVGR
jgi:hypothetical protein